MKTINPAPSDQATRLEFRNTMIHLPLLIVEAMAAGETLVGRRFIDCVIRGPAILIPYTDTRFVTCNLGEVAGSVSNLFLHAAGDKIIGAIGIPGCVFEQCLFIDVGFAGNAVFMGQFASQLDAKP